MENTTQQLPTSSTKRFFSQKVSMYVVVILVLLLPIVSLGAYLFGRQSGAINSLQTLGGSVVLPSPLTALPVAGTESPPPQQDLCPTDLQLCPNGMSVSRMLPSCEFGPCPEVVLPSPAL